MNEVTKAAPQAGGMRLYFSGVGVPPRSGPVGGAAARLSGVLARLGDCLVVTAPNGSRVQPVSRAGKAFWDEAAGALIFAGRSYRAGDRIEFGGGGIGSPAAYARETGVEIAPCAEAGLWAVNG
jgi:hypothetical protein